MTVIDEAWGEFIVEKYVSLQSDPPVTNMNVAPTRRYVPAGHLPLLEAPIQALRAAKKVR